MLQIIFLFEYNFLSNLFNNLLILKLISDIFTMTIVCQIYLKTSYI